MSKESAEYVLDRIESMLRLQDTRTDSDGLQAADELTHFRTRVQSMLSGETTKAEDDIETAFYELLGNQRTLGLAFLDAMEADLNKAGGGTRPVAESA